TGRNSRAPVPAAASASRLCRSDSLQLSGCRRRTSDPSLPPPRGRRLGTPTMPPSGIGAEGETTRTSEIRLPARSNAWSITRAGGSPLGGRLVRTQMCTAGMLRGLHQRRASGQGAVQERGQLPAGDRLVGAEPVVSGRVAAPGHAGAGEGVEVLLEHRVVVVADPHRAGRQVEGAAEEGGQLPAGDGPTGAVPVVSGRVAALGQAGVGEGIYVVLEHRVVVVDARGGAGGQVEGAAEAGGQPPAGDSPGRAAPVV